MTIPSDVQAAALINSTTGLIKVAMAHQHTLLHNTLWDNTAATPSQVLAQLGTDAVTRLELLDNLATLLLPLGVTVPAVPGNWVVTKNSNGTATVAPAA
jgi:hypothetical protein